MNTQKLYLSIKDSGWQVDEDIVDAKKISEGIYQISSIPFYAYGVAKDDIVKTLFIKGKNYVDKIVKHNGNSLLSVIFKDSNLTPHQQQLEYLDEISKMGCDFDKPLYSMFVINVPSNISLEKVLENLKKGEEEGIWEYEEGYVHK